MNEEAQQIEAYLLGQLDEEDARRVEARAASDPAFARELQLQRDILKGVELFGDEQMREKIAAVDQELETEGFFDAPQGGARTKLLPWAAAAVLLLALGAGVWYALDRSQTQQAPPPPEPVATVPKVEPATPGAAENTTETAPEKSRRPAGNRYAALARDQWSTPDYSNLRTTRQQAPTLRSRAAGAFQAGDYPTVIRLLETLTPAEPNYWELSEMYAHACFLAGQTARAAVRFRQIADSGQLPFSERADWHLLLCQLAELPANRAAFDTSLKKILSDDGHPFVEKARNLKRQVEAAR